MDLTSLEIFRAVADEHDVRGARELGEGVVVLPVELHRAAAAEAARRLRAEHGICVRLEDIARPDE